MAFVDEVTIRATAGKGGNGVIRWLRNKETARGGPSGGDGGRGGDIVLRGVRDLAALANYKYEKDFNAEHGAEGENQNRHGKNGESLVLAVPVGTVARATSVDGKVDTYEINNEGEDVVIFRGGNGGLGNSNYKSSTNQNPFKQTDGKAGQGGDIFLTLKLIADAGLIGLPNAGKSSLLNELTRAKSKVGSYAFTTLEPSLGDFYGFILADIPGLIEGASAGRGLGIKFLKHIERTKILLHLVSSTQDDPIVAYREVRGELEKFGQGLGSKREVVILSKTDEISPEECASRAKALAAESGNEVLAVSVLDSTSVKKLADRLATLLRS